MQSKPRLTGSVMAGLVELMGIAAAASEKEAAAWWSGKEQEDVLRACRWVEAMRAWRKEKRASGIAGRESC